MHVYGVWKLIPDPVEGNELGESVEDGDPTDYQDLEKFPDF